VRFGKVDKLSAVQVKEMMLQVAKAMIESKEALCQADRNIGDGDHGIGMAEGFGAVLRELEDREFDDIYQIFFTIGRTLIKTMGGASGIIFGLLFYAGAKNMPPKPEITTGEYYELFRKALSEVQAKGGAQLGDKTIVDALSPMVESLKDSVAQNLSFKEMLSRAYLAAEQGKEDSKQYVAKFGKAKTLGERAIGFPDPGCVSLSIIAKACSEWGKTNL
jgi:dihydroxyacetone kinase phosphoprotein-dependent L subunit